MITDTGKEIHFKEFLGIYSVYSRFSLPGNHRLMASSSLATLSAPLTIETRGLWTVYTNASYNPFKRLKQPQQDEKYEKETRVAFVQHSFLYVEAVELTGQS